MVIQKQANMYSLQITDNHDWKAIAKCLPEGVQEVDVDKIKSDLGHIANVIIGEIKIEDNLNLLVFPHNLHQHGDEIGKSQIIAMRGDEISTGNIMGFVGINDYLILNEMV